MHSALQKWAAAIVVAFLTFTTSLVVAQSSGFPSRPRFQTVTIATTASPQLAYNDTDAAAGARCYMSRNAGGSFFVSLGDDTCNPAANAIQVTGSAGTVSTINLTGTAVQANGVAMTPTGIATRHAYAQLFESAGSCAVNGSISNNNVTAGAYGGVAGRCGFTLSGFTAIPVCVASANAANIISTVTCSSATACTMNNQSDAGTPTSAAAYIACMGP